MKKIFLTAWTHRIILVALLALAGGSLFMYEIEAHPDFLRTSASIEKNSEISPAASIVVNFSQPVSAESYNGKIKINPASEARTDWQDSGRKLLITPKNNWKPETQYSLTLGAGKNKFFLDTDPANFSFSTASYPRIAGFYPAAGTKNVILDIEDPIAVDFTRSTEDFFIKFELDPPTVVAYQNNPEKTHFELLPETPIKEGQEYEVKIYAKFNGDSDNNYRQIYSSSFQTLPPKPQIWDKDFSVRIEQIKTYTQAKISEGKYIDINLAAQMLSIFENGKLLDSYLVSTGKRGMETPRGTHAIANKFPRAWSKKYGLFMPYWMAIMPSGSYGIHELPEWPGGYKEGKNHLGIPVSHGCVRLGVGPAKRVYDWAEIGTPVVVY